MLSHSVNLDTLVQLTVGVGSAVLALLLMMIKIPQTAYSATITIAAKMAMLDNVLIVENTRASELDELHKQVEGKK